MEDINKSISNQNIEDHKQDYSDIKHIRNIEDAAERKKVFKEVRQGKAKGSKQIEAAAKNLIPLNERTPEEAAEIRRKGAMAVNQLRGEKKNAKQILDALLPIYANDSAIKNNNTIPEDIKEMIIKKNIKVTQYDLLYMSMLYEAQHGNVKAAEYIRDTNGEKPINETHNINETISESDKALIKNLQERLNIVDIDTTGD